MESELGLEQLKLLKKVFDEADDDGSGELDIEEFCEQLGPYLGKNLTRTEINQLFMKIDADAGGTVDWDEFTNYMFLQRSENDDDNVENWKFFPMAIPDRNDPITSHHDTCTKMRYFPQIDRYITCGRDSTIRAWSAADMKHVRTINTGSQWVNDCAFLESQRKVVAVSMDRTISYYDVNRGCYDLTGRVYTSGSMGVPMCVNTVMVNGKEHVMYGDTVGAVVLLLCDSTELPARDLLYTAHHQDYLYLHTEHKDWVTKVESVPDIGTVSASMDSLIHVTDIGREKVVNTARHHSKGVHDFVWCRSYSLFASCGERNIVLWQGNTTRKVSDLQGHSSTVMHLAMDEKTQHLISMSTDKVIKVWDLRTNKCLQSIGHEDWVAKEAAQPTSMLYDSRHRRLVTAARKPYIWDHKLVMQDRTGHREPVVRALHNSAFEVVVSVDSGGSVIVWNLETGAREGRFHNAHGGSRVTTACFDSNQRRLVTAGNDGRVKIWNFNNGSLLRQYAHREQALEVTRVLFFTDAKRQSDCVYAAGWNCKVFIWEDEDEDVVEEYKTLTGHNDDILSMDVHSGRSLLATGDYEGRINVWNIASGERRASMYHRADRYDNGVEALQWLPVAQPRGGVAEGGAATLLISGGADGIIRVWRVDAAGRLLCTLDGATGHLEAVRDLCRDAAAENVVMADSSGHLRVWDVSDMDVSTPESTRASFRQRAYFRVSEAAVHGVQCVADRGMVLAASADTNVYLFLLTGGLVGVFGSHEWDLHDVSTYHDPEGASAGAPADTGQALLEAAKLRLDDGDEDNACEEAEVMPWDGLEPATHALKERSDRIQADLVRRPAGAIHGHLRVHNVQDVPGSIAEILHLEPKPRRGGLRRDRP